MTTYGTLTWNWKETEEVLNQDGEWKDVEFERETEIEWEAEFMGDKFSFGATGEEYEIEIISEDGDALTSKETENIYDYIAENCLDD